MNEDLANRTKTAGALNQVCVRQTSQKLKDALASGKMQFSKEEWVAMDVRLAPHQCIVNDPGPPLDPTTGQPPHQFYR